VDLDTWYIEHRNFLTDIQIIAKTGLVVVFGEKRNEKHLARAVSAAMNREIRHF
jgi:hypothetical protein